MTIRAPFNFVPLNDKVFFPDWADKISQDIPFSDGMDGIIDLKIKSESPIFVRNGHTSQDANEKNDIYKSFSKVGDDKYFIPGTSIKGSIRNVLEIMSFGKLTQLEDDTFPFRDLNNRDYRDKMKSIHCGWLKLENDKYVISDWGFPKRISLKSIDEQFHLSLESFALSKDNLKKDENRTARKKYELLRNNNLLMNSYFVKDSELENKMRKKNPVDKREFVKFGGNQKGILVFTGQPSFRNLQKNKKSGKKEWKGKYYEFVFMKPSADDRWLPVEDDIIFKFKSVYKYSLDYKDFWGKSLMKGKSIPVFFQYMNEKNKDKIHSIGLSYLYKYPFKKSVYDAIPQELRQDKGQPFKADLCDCIMGYSSKYTDDSLRGRVQFGHAFVEGYVQPMEENTFISSSPHASFYPLYTENGYDWNRVEKIAGRKQYPIRNGIYYDVQGTGGMKQTACMLNSGTLFEGKIHFHNLRPIELGALLSALTFHNSRQCKHSLGFGKAYGYGKVSIEASLLNELNGQELKMMGIYENSMNQFCRSKSINSGWLESEQIRELTSMAIGIPKGSEDNFTYLQMSIDSKNNQFKQVKNSHESLQRFTKITREVNHVQPINMVAGGPLQNNIKGDVPNNVIKKIKSESVPKIIIDNDNIAIGTKLKAHCVANKKVTIKGLGDNQIQLIVPKIIDSSQLVGKYIDVIVKQISKKGVICQVEYLK